MEGTGKHSANSGGEIPQIGHRPGRPKGLPRPDGSGRKPGTPNRATRDVREAAQKHSAKAIATLVKLLSDPDSRVQATAAREILDRAHGKPMTPTEITGKDGAPLNPSADLPSDFELARRMVFTITANARAATGSSHSPRSTDEALRMLEGTWKGPDADPEATMLDLTPAMLAPSDKPGWYNGEAPTFTPTVQSERTPEEIEAVALRREEEAAQRREDRASFRTPNIIRRADR